MDRRPDDLERRIDAAMARFGMNQTCKTVARRRQWHDRAWQEATRQQRATGMRGLIGLLHRSNIAASLVEKYEQEYQESANVAVLN
ncbi:hypothetical protein H7Q97_02760 [Ochrobactrum sp. CM-21-5]|nr:hypothetical protein [Ochrobactrum sp. CM-21-5]MBC2884321.1 hypothetical protein [Ochrobactrum sp. CM-21-5]